MKLKIKVTKEILERSKMCGEEPEHMRTGYVESNCAIALAVRELLPTCFVMSNEIREQFFKSFDNWRIPLPHEAIHFIDLFDTLPSQERVEMPEIEFEVEIPQELINSISIEGIKDLIKDSKTLELV